MAAQLTVYATATLSVPSGIGLPVPLDYTGVVERGGLLYVGKS